MRSFIKQFSIFVWKKKKKFSQRNFLVCRNECFISFTIIRNRGAGYLVESITPTMLMKRFLYFDQTEILRESPIKIRNFHFKLLFPTEFIFH